MNKLYKGGLIVLTSLVGIIAIFLLMYLFLIPTIVKNPNFIEYVEKMVKNSCGAELILDRPVLKTSVSTKLGFFADSIVLTKDGKTLLNIQKLDSEVSFKKILLKKVILNKLGADDVYVDINALQELTTKEGEEAKPMEYKILWFNSILYLKKCLVLYRPTDNVLVKVFAKDLEITKQKNPKYVHFAILTDIEIDKNRFRLMFKDFDTIYFKDKKINVDNFKFIVGKSMVAINGFYANDGKYKFDIISNNFDVNNVKYALESNLIIPDRKGLMDSFKDLYGSLNLKFSLANNDFKGEIKLNKSGLKLVPIANLPIVVNNGLIKLDTKNIELKDFKGYYGSRATNKIEMYGYVKNYAKTANTMIALIGDLNNELAGYVSKVAGCNINLKNTSKIALRIDSDVSGKLVIAGGAKIPKGAKLYLENTAVGTDKFDKAVGLKLILLKDMLEIEHINLYVSDYIATSGKPTSKSIISIKSKINIVKGILKELELVVPEPLPSEVFNVFLSQKVFRGGTIVGDLKYNNNDNKNPKLFGNAKIKDVVVSGQGLIIKNGSMTSDKDNIHLFADGYFRRTTYKADSIIQNKMLFPIIVKDTNITFNELDIEKVLQTFAPRKPLTEEQKIALKKRIAEMKIARSDVPTKYFEIEEKSVKQKENTEPIKFQPNLVAIRRCDFHVGKGKYKLVNFANLHADLTLTEKGILEIKSNKFDFADGISTLKVYCDMVKEKYSIRLGAKDVNSDAIATSMLNLPREISGKASALLEFYSDSNGKLNGRIQFAINDGSIQKLGLVQYILNVAAIFRNPIAMISPTTLVDLVNVPDGGFKKINGDLRIKNNVIERMMIKSSSPQLSAFIIGSINLNNFDSSLRIYTKFSGKNKGVMGFLRNISLNSLASKSKLNNNANYYANELKFLPPLETGEDIAQVFLTKVDGDLQTNNFISSLKKIK